MRGSTLFILSLLLVLLIVSTNGYRYVHHREHSSFGVPRRYVNDHSYGHLGSRHDTYLARREVNGDSLSNHLAYIRDTGGEDVDRTKAQQLAKQRIKKRRRYN